MLEDCQWFEFKLLISRHALRIRPLGFISNSSLKPISHKPNYKPNNNYNGPYSIRCVQLLKPIMAYIYIYIYIQDDVMQASKFLKPYNLHHLRNFVLEIRLT